LALDLFVNMGYILIIAGFAVIVLAVLSAVFHAGRGGRVQGGGIILIGPIPIVFGSDAKTVKSLVYLAIVLMVIVAVLMIIPNML